MDNVVIPKHLLLDLLSKTNDIVKAVYKSENVAISSIENAAYDLDVLYSEIVSLLKSKGEI